MIDGTKAGLSAEDHDAVVALGLDPTLYEPHPHERFGHPYRFPYHLGLYMAVNAIPGCFVIIDGPDCIYRKAEWIHGKHDLSSSLLDACGRHRVVSTLLHSGEVIKSKGEAVVKRLRRLSQLPEAELVLVNSMPHVQIIGTQYDALIASVEDEVPQRIYEVPSRSLESDWIDAYAETLNTLARRLPISPGGLIDDQVAIMGVLMDRVEADHTANVAELERLVAGLGLDPVSTWLSNRPLAHLLGATRAATLLALPHGVAAARALAKRTGAQVVEVDQPFGLRASARMVRALAAATGREARAASLIDAELSLVVPRFEWLVSSLLLGRKLAFSGDPTLFDGLLEGAGELGMEVLHLSAAARRPEFGVDLSAARHGPVPPPLFAPTVKTLERHVRGLCSRVGLDLVIAGSEFPADEPSRADARAPGRMYFGFPNFFKHALYDSPFLGFRGWAWFVQEMVNTIVKRPRMLRAEFQPDPD
ncbi:nitrogenase component 1 [Enhygromyxa salina]|uniref:Light-independent protochlorophyllide reductase subunit N n=1 Tax=Enhygromyxa salina TaxID=215803 RepID=A0A2S9XN36_9BACT|nr:nitrogenase component 1 [Enhygromyxa salina]PRP94278.1 light-independent protochlorophyllide reductase subunit N [Enhygromyxa salina]